MFIAVKALHPVKAPVPSVERFFGSVTDVKAVQFLNADAPIVVTLAGIDTVLSPVQSIKALLAISVMPFAIVTDVSLLLIMNAPLPIEDTVLFARLAGTVRVVALASVESIPVIFTVPSASTV